MKHLKFGSKGPLHIRYEVIGSDQESAWRILYVSDLHLTAGRCHLIQQILDAVQEATPDVILLGGDLIDRQTGLAALAHCVRTLSRVAPTYAIEGNHDAFSGANAVQNTVVENGGQWLPHQEAQIERPGRRTLHLSSDPRRRKTKEDLHVLVAHNPKSFPRACSFRYDAVFAGHLHGCQCVLWEHGGRLYPGALVYRWNGLRFHSQDTTMLVSRGVADTLPIRFRCPREVVLCQIG